MAVKTGKRPYVRPVKVTEKMFETTALACGKCASGPFPQYQCGVQLRTS